MIISVRLQRPGFHSALGVFALGDGSALTRGGTGFKQVIFKCRETEAVPSLREYSAEMAFEKMSCKQFGRLDVYSRKWGTYLTPPPRTVPDRDPTLWASGIFPLQHHMAKTCSCTSWSVMHCLFTSLLVLSELNGWIPFMLATVTVMTSSGVSNQKSCY